MDKYLYNGSLTKIQVNEPPLLNIEKKISRIASANYNLRSLAYTDNTTIGIGEYRDLKIVKKLLELHCTSSNDKINTDKTLRIKIGRPEFEINEFKILDDHTNYKYLGFIFNNNGVNYSDKYYTETANERQQAEKNTDPDLIANTNTNEINGILGLNITKRYPNPPKK
ncbi:hypothetical protein BB559_002797 [Furculomyces boomerangus]|uniref:Uncharacterized protein n=2 Tax=Harpellales TaxID=61421 RepID=A0A2T9YSC7_9FUNG|nr:hypothetical protein BB559_002797 [Furculomyces boomerangus]PWA01262.1 hypothetical protein BB558_002650 [Smittium angustum]